MSIGRRTVRWGAPIVALLAASVAWCVRSPRMSASLYDMIGREADRIPQFVRDSSSSDLSVIVSSEDRARAESVAKALGGMLRGERRAQGEPLQGAALDFLRENRAGLVTPEAARELATQAGRTKIFRRALRRTFGSPVPPLLGYEADPFGLADAVLPSLAPQPKELTRDGYQLLVTNGVTHILLNSRMDAEIAADLDRTISFCKNLESAARDLSAQGGVTVRLAGAPAHAAVAASRSKAEIGILTWFSLAVIVGLALFAFGSWGWLPLFVGSLAGAAFAGATVLFLAFKEIHVMTLVMGTTVLGLVVDYSFHWLLTPEPARESVKRGLLVSFVTTEISLVPLMLASIPILRQSAVFLGVSLAAALGYVLWAYPTERPRVSPAVGGRRISGKSPLCWSPIVLGTLAVAALIGLARVSFDTEVTSVYRPTRELAEAERIRAAFGLFDFTAIPSFGERCAIADHVIELYAEHGKEMARTLGLETLVPPPRPQDRLMRPKDLMDAIFRSWTNDALKRLGASLLVLLATLAFICRRRALRIVFPPTFAILAVTGVLGWAGVRINLFHVLAAFLLLGMGVDYAVFLESGESSAFRPSVCSLLTSTAGFGSLAFVSFPAIGSFGLVIGIGLPVAFVSSFLLGTVPAVGTDPGGEAGTDPLEHGANPIGLSVLFAVYRLFGLRALHAFSALVGCCVWIFSPAVRRASPGLRKVVNFTGSLADKLVVMAAGRNLPRVEADGSTDAEAFIGDVQSGRGVFVLSSHVGTIEVLTALGECNCTFHAWMDFDRTGVFNRFYMNHAKRRLVVMHPISEFGMQTVFEAGEIIDSGNCLLMAGDRGEGAFRFAAAFDHPVYFVACIAERGLRYRTVVKRLPDGRLAMKAAYDAILLDLIRAHPEQHFDWGR